MFRTYTFAITSALSQAAAWHAGITLESAILGWLSVLFLVLALKSANKKIAPIYFSGCIVYALGFSWLYSTIKSFGGFPTTVSFLLFILFVSISSIQYALVSILYYRASEFTAFNQSSSAKANSAFSTLVSWLEKSYLIIPLSWISSQIIWISIFPWQPGHTQLGFLEFSQIASIGGVNLITFIMFWCATVFADVVIKKPLKITASYPLLLFMLCYLYGHSEIFRYNFSSYYLTENNQQGKVAVIQANVELFNAHNMLMYEVNKKRYQELSDQIAEPGMLIIWPEAVNNEFVPDEVREALGTIPKAINNANLLYGGLTFDKERRAFNSSLAVLNDGQILKPYHKQVLMPFGEYMPFSSIWPELEKLLPTGASFSPGKYLSIFEINSSIKASPLICYEDLVPELSRKAALIGANLLVNQTNDVWFGESLAPFHHHRMASFRAIENRRTLVRSTNSGFSAIVNPIGETIGEIAPFSDGTLVREVRLSNEISFYTRYIGEMPWKIMAWGWIFLVIFLIRSRKNNPNR